MIQLDHGAARGKANALGLMGEHDPNGNLARCYLNIVRKLEHADAQIEQSRKALCSNGYCGDGNLPQLIERALEEAVRNTRKEWEGERQEIAAAFISCWQEMPGDIENSKLSNAIRELVKRVEGNASNTSDEYRKMVDEVEEIIRRSGNDLVCGNSRSVAAAIMSNLAHKYGMVPGNDGR